MGKIKSLIVTLALMGMLWWVFELTDMYSWAAHQIMEGVLVVAGMIGIGLSVYLFLRVGDAGVGLLRKPKKQPWEVEWTSGQWQR